MRRLRLLPVPRRLRCPAERIVDDRRCSHGVGNRCRDGHLESSCVGKDEYPNQYASYIDAGYETYDDRQPDAHGKVNTFFQRYDFSNMTPETGCMRCHTSEFSSLVKEHGDGLFAMDFTDFRRQVTVGVTCYSCHGNNPGELTPANTWVIDAAKRGGIETDEKNLVCAQCHALPDWGTIMDNPDPSSWSMLQFGLDADAYWEHYEASGNENPIVPAG